LAVIFWNAILRNPPGFDNTRKTLQNDTEPYKTKANAS
jgi:hypothetical protein